MYLEANQVPAHLKGNYSGKSFQAEAAESVTVPYHAGLWDGGSRTTYAAVELATGKTAAVSDNMSAPWHSGRADYKIPLKSGYAIVKHSIFCGKDMGLTFYVHPADIVQLIPNQSGNDLSETELKVLAIIRGIKSGYRLDYFRRAKISENETEAIKSRLIAAGYLTRAGAITVKGRNACEDVSPY